jgi:hypothetical protein
MWRRELRANEGTGTLRPRAHLKPQSLARFDGVEGGVSHDLQPK